MLRLTTDQPDFGDYLLPGEARRMHPELRVPEEVEAPGLADQPGFSLRLPTGWELRETQPLDSYVGELVGDGVKPESTEGGRRVSVLKRQEGAPVLLG